MSKIKKQEIIVEKKAAFKAGTIVSITKQINGKSTGIGTVEQCDDRTARVAFNKGHLAGKTLRVPVHAIEVSTVK
jgi:FKBP-type peptidyl-prolyl cis-trans isomerase 2